MRFGAAASRRASRPAAGRARAGATRARTGGCSCAAAASPRLRERAHRLVGGGERARRRAQLLGRRAEQLGERVDAVERVGRLRQRARQLVHGGGDVGLLLGERVEHGGRGVDQPREVVVVLGELGREDVERADEVAQLLAARGDLAVDEREVAVGRLEAREQVAQVAAAPLQPLPEAVDQQLQVLARVGVEHREDLVRVDVRLRRRDRDREAALGHRRVAAARLQVDEHVLQPGLGPQQRGRVGVDQILVLGIEVHLDHGVAVLEVDAADVADAHAGDAHGLALAGDDGLRGRELRLQLVGLRLDEREAHALLVEDVDRDAGGDQDRAR